MFTSAILADQVLKGLYGSVGLWNKMNRAYDSLVLGATMDSIDVPINPQLIASSTAVGKTHASRKKAKGDTSSVNVPFVVYTVPMTQEEEERILMGGALLRNFLLDANDALTDSLDAAVIAEAQTTDKVLAWAGAKLSWDDIIALDAKFDDLKVPRAERIVVIPSAIKADFMAIDVVKQAMAFNRELLEKGIFVINNTQFYVSADVGKISGKNNIVGIAPRGLAVVLKGFMNRKEDYDTDSRVTYIDYNTGVAIKLLRKEYAVVSKQP